MRITKVVCLATALTFGGVASAEELIHATMYKNPYCDCCEGHADYLRQNGFDVEIKVVEDLITMQRAQGVPEELDGCHMIVIDGMVVEGHVTAPIIRKLLNERPAGVVGISIPGMPTGVPGMPGTKEGPVDIYAFGQGKTTVFAVE